MFFGLLPSAKLDFPYPIGYGSIVIEVRQTDLYARWFDGLRDRQARVESWSGSGGCRLVTPATSDRWGRAFRPGYRVYFVSRGQQLIILLAGGDKQSQASDIQVARDLARSLQD